MNVGENTNGSSTDSDRPHRCCYLPKKVENTDYMPDNPYILQQIGRCPSSIPSSSLPFHFPFCYLWIALQAARKRSVSS